MEFFDATWQSMGTKENLAALISEKTGISAACLRDPSLVRQQSVAARMSWAVGRDTTTDEDKARSLLEIFGVSLRPIFGEGGQQAFIRLQELILEETSDFSLLAAGDREHQVGSGTAFALSPEAFAGSRDLAFWPKSKAKLFFGESLEDDGIKVTVAMLSGDHTGKTLTSKRRSSSLAMCSSSTPPSDVGVVPRTPSPK